MSLQVKARVAALFLSFMSGAVAEETPDAQSILKAVRLNQTEQHRELKGRLRNDDAVIPLRLVMNGGEFRYEFTNPEQAIVLRLGEKGSELREEMGGSSKRVGAGKFDTPVRGTDITYEDLALRFLYWPKAKIDGEESFLMRRCWKLHLEPAARGDSQYSVVILWVEKESGAFLRADGYDWNLKLAKRFEVRDVQKSEGVWILKKMRIERMDAGKKKDISPTYLELQK